MHLTSTLKFLNQNGTEAKPAYIREWDGLDRKQLRKLEAGQINVLHQLNNLPEKDPKHPLPNTNPLKVVYTSHIIDDQGKDFSISELTWFNLGDEYQTALRGMLDGALAAIDTDVKGKEKKPKKPHPAHP